jgi:hypothetical protein
VTPEQRRNCLPDALSGPHYRWFHRFRVARYPLFRLLAELWSEELCRRRLARIWHLS